jgi:hypothetical protein
MAKFEPGRSGNPAGRPKGVKDKRNELREMLAANAPALLQAAINRAIDGDSVVLNALISKIVPKGLPQPLPSLDADATIEHNAHAILASVIDGSITIEEAGGVLALLKGQADLADRGPMLDAIGTLLKDRGLPLPANLRLREAHGKRD